MDELLKSFLGGGNQPAKSSNPMVDMLGSILGGSAQNQPSGNLMNDLIGSFITGGGLQNSGSIAGLIGAALGGGTTASNPLVNTLAERLGLSPAIAQVIVSYFVTKILSAKMGLPSGTEQSGSFQTNTPQSQVPGLNLDHLLDIMGDPKTLNNHLNATGMPQELAQQAGITPSMASQGIQELLKVVAENVQSPQPVTTPESSLKGLLDSW